MGEYTKRRFRKSQARLSSENRVTMSQGVSTPVVYGEGLYEPNPDANLLNDSAIWVKDPHAIILGDSFKTYAEVIKFALQGDKDEATDESTKTGIDGIIEAFTTGDMDYYTKPNYADTSVGGNDAINPYWQFCRDDDIIHPLTSIDGIGNKGMGRVYSEKYENNQQILWITCGVPKFRNMISFYTDAFDNDLADLMNSGEESFFAKLGNLLLDTVVLAIKLPFLPIQFLAWLVKSCDITPITKYYELKNTMLLYYRLVNGVLAHLAQGLGLLPWSLDKATGGLSEGDQQKLFRECGTPEILKHGPDIFAIIDKRGARLNDRPPLTTDELIEDYKKSGTSRKWYNAFADGFKTSMFGGSDFVGFRIERSVDSSESFSNQTGPSPLADRLNAHQRERMTQAFDTDSVAGAVGNLSGSAGGAIHRLTSTAMNIYKRVTGEGNDYAKLKDIGLELVSGNGYFDIPEIWTGSNMSKSYSFTMKLRARYGDPVTIFQSIYVPFAMIYAMSSPRQTGENTYTSPFLLRCYCKGMFAIALGIIDNVQIVRGAPEYGWNYNNLPLSMTISFSIKDLSPTMFIALADESFLSIFTRNNAMHEYLDTLSGIGLAERYFYLASIKRKLSAYWHIKKTTAFSPLYWGNVLGRSVLPRAIAAIQPFHKVSMQ